MKDLQAWIERYFPCPFKRGAPLLVAIGVSSALVYVFTRIAFKNELQDLPQNLMVLTFIVSAWSQRRKLRSDLVFRLLLLAILIPIVLFGINAMIDYESAVRYRSLNDLLKLFLFLPLAWWMGGTRAGATRMLAIALLGLITAVAMDPNLARSLGNLWAGQRVDFGIYNAQHGALFFGLVVIFCICSLGQRIHDAFRVDRNSLLLILAGLFGLAGFLGTQTRGAFLGLLLAGFAALLLRLYRGNLLGRIHLSRSQGALVLVLVTGLLAWGAKEFLHDRISAEQTSLQALLSGNLQALPFDNIGMRVHTWAESLEWIAERPITGWGQKARSDVVQLSDRFPDDIKALGYGHLHNGYLEIALGFGIVGLVFICTLWVVLLRRIRLAASKDFYTFALYGSIFFLVLNLFESFFIYSSGEFSVALLMAAGYSQYLSSSLGSNSPREAAPNPLPE